jgi:hypothetical protein
MPQHGYFLHEPEMSAPRWFRGELAAAYLAPPLALVVLTFTGNNDAIFFTSLLGVAGVAVPPLVHSLEGDSSGAFRSLLGMVGASGTGALSGVAIGHIAPGDTTHDRAEKRDAAVFGLLGYSLWALIDIAFFAVVTPHAQELTLSCAPVGTASTRGAPSGLVLHVTTAL